MQDQDDLVQVRLLTEQAVTDGLLAASTALTGLTGPRPGWPEVP